MPEQSAWLLVGYSRIAFSTTLSDTTLYVYGKHGFENKRELRILLRYYSKGGSQQWQNRKGRKHEKVSRCLAP